MTGGAATIESELVGLPPLSRVPRVKEAEDYHEPSAQVARTNSGSRPRLSGNGLSEPGMFRLKLPTAESSGSSLTASGPFVPARWRPAAWRNSPL
jgi:hypothetical protein